ncbi:TetR/AcrR family transcriptional regulator [Arthrobacter sp. H35-D1]|nr:TetR/AcrR family transcriptional regulator [Arthrobacter sp. H35-D1]
MSIQHLGATTSTDSLRNRKRAATRLAIRRAAIELGLEHGYEHVTVDMICAVCKVSPRTFFNYFGSKEGVYASPSRAMPSEQQRRSFVECSNSGVFDDLFSMVADSLVEVDSNLELFQARHQLIHQTPELLLKEKSRITEVEEIYVGYVLERYRFQGRSETETPDLSDEAHLVVALVSGAMRFALQKWVAGNFHDTPEDLVRSASALVHRIASNEHWP